MIPERNRLLFFLAHLRKAILQILGVVLAASVGGYFFSQKVLLAFMHHTGVSLAYYGLPETFVTLLKIALFLGLFVSFPFVLFKLIQTGTRLMENPSRGMLFSFTATSIFLFYLGAFFCIFVTLPYGIKFLLSYQTDNIQAIISVNKFMGFCLMFILAFGLIFELPPLLIFLSKMHLVSASFLSRYRRYAILIIAILAAVLTPTPDVFNMMLMGVPLYILFEIGVLGVRMVERGRRKKAGRLSADEV
jgi:sec-independent protein translocase protein TatC